jgi:hypothetical protein
MKSTLKQTETRAEIERKRRISARFYDDGYIYGEPPTLPCIRCEETKFNQGIYDFQGTCIWVIVKICKQCFDITGTNKIENELLKKKINEMSPELAETKFGAIVVSTRKRKK